MCVCPDGLQEESEWQDKPVLGEDPEGSFWETRVPMAL